MALRFTKSWILSITTVRTDSEGNQATTLEDVKGIVRRAVFPRQPENPVGPPSPRLGTANRGVNTHIVCRALYDQELTNIPGPHGIKFQALRFL